MRQLAFLFLITAAAAHAEEPTLWAGLEAGQFHVGYVNLETADIWYPAKNDGEPLTFRAYERGDDPAQLADSPVYARAGASAAAGAHPLVLIAQGNGQDAADQAILSEYLASHGYVVVSAPSPMLALRMTSEAQVGAFAEAQKNALVAARRVVAARFRIGRCAAVVGHSFGARAALLLAMSDPSIRAMVSLDGGVGTATGIASLKEAPSFNANASLPPLLHIYELQDAFMRPDFRFIESLPFRELQLQQAVDMHHVHFTTYGFAATGPRVRQNVVATAWSVLAFIRPRAVCRAARE
jgi:dienelactone hydrolase